MVPVTPVQYSRSVPGVPAAAVRSTLAEATPDGRAGMVSRGVLVEMVKVTADATMGDGADSVPSEPTQVNEA